MNYLLGFFSRLGASFLLYHISKWFLVVKTQIQEAKPTKLKVSRSLSSSSALDFSQCSPSFPFDFLKGHVHHSLKHLDRLSIIMIVSYLKSYPEARLFGIITHPRPLKSLPNGCQSRNWRRRDKVSTESYRPSFATLSCRKTGKYPYEDLCRAGKEFH